MKKNRSETVSPEVDKSRRQFLKHSSTLTFTALVTTALPMSALLTGCDATLKNRTYALTALIKDGFSQSLPSEKLLMKSQIASLSASFLTR